MKWFEQLGYPENPLLNGESPQLQESADELVYHIEAGNMILIQGPAGSGKTTLLRRAIDQYRGEKKVIYFDCKNQDVNIRSLMQNRYGWFGKLFNITPRNMILLLDNFTTLSQNDLERIKYYFDNDFLRSIVLASEDEPKLPESVKDRIGYRVVHLHPLTEKQAVEMVKTRLGTTDLLPEPIIKKIFEKSQSDMQAFLRISSAALQHAAEDGSDSVKQEHIDKVT